MAGNDVFLYGVPSDPDIDDVRLYDVNGPAVAITGTMAAQESGSDSFAGAGKVAVSGALVAQETGADTFAATGTVTSAAITGTLAAQESGSDTFACVGNVAGGIPVPDQFFGGGGGSGYYGTGKHRRKRDIEKLEEENQLWAFIQNQITPETYAPQKAVAIVKSAAMVTGIKVNKQIVTALADRYRQEVVIPVDDDADDLLVMLMAA